MLTSVGGVNVGPCSGPISVQPLIPLGEFCHWYVIPTPAKLPVTDNVAGRIAKPKQRIWSLAGKIVPPFRFAITVIWVGGMVIDSHFTPLSSLITTLWNQVSWVNGPGEKLSVAGGGPSIPTGLKVIPSLELSHL